MCRNVREASFKEDQRRFVGKTSPLSTAKGQVWRTLPPPSFLSTLKEFGSERPVPYLRVPFGRAGGGSGTAGGSCFMYSQRRYSTVTNGHGSTEIQQWSRSEGPLQAHV